MAAQSSPILPQFLLIFLPIFLFFLQSLPTTNADGHDVLVNAPTFLDKHLDVSILLARILAEDGHRVHLLFMNSGNLADKTLADRVEEENGKIKAHFEGKVGTSGSTSPKHPKEKGHGKAGKLTFEIVQLPKFVALMDKKLGEGGENPVELVGNKWQKRGTKQDEKILKNEALNVYEEFFDSNEAKETMKRLREKQFSYALFDTWDFGAQYIFFVLGIHKVEAFNKISLLSYQMEYAKTLSKHLEEHVPEVYAAKIGDAKPKVKAHFGVEHKANMDVFKKVHGEMDKWFNGNMEKFRNKFGIPESTEWPYSIENIYAGEGGKGGVENIFMDSHKALDFDLGDAKPKNAHYFGGITLVDRPEFERKEAEEKDGENPRKHSNLVIVSLDLCDQLANEQNKHGFGAFLEAFKEFGNKHSDKKMKFQIDCEDKEGKMKSLVEGGQSQNVVFLKSEKKLQDAIFHKETRLLISSCSGGPVIDALGAGVPLICVPLMVDQFYISQALQLEGKDHGRMSIALDTNKIMNDQKLAPQIGGEIGKTLVKPAEAIYEALDTILNKDEKKYLDEAHKLQKEMHKSAIQARADFLAAFRNSSPSQEEGHSGGSKVGGHGGHE